MNRLTNHRFALTVGIGCLLLTAATGARAQTTGTVSNLYLSPGGELDFLLYGTQGGSGTNGTHSNRIDVQNQFASTNPSSSGTYTIGFGLDNDTPLVQGSNFTLITFGTTNFSDASKFRAAPRSNGSGNPPQSIDGFFTLVSPSANNSQRGSLVFTLTSYSVVPEPTSLSLLAVVFSLARPFAWCFLERGQKGQCLLLRTRLRELLRELR